MTLDRFVPTEPPAGSSLWASCKVVAEKSILPGDDDRTIGEKMYYSDLGSVVISAATELDHASLGRRKNDGSPERLAAVISEATNMLLSDSRDYSSLTVLYQTFNPGKEPATTDQLYADVMRNLKPLEEQLRGYQSLSVEKLGDLRDLCLRLMQEARAEEVPAH